MFLPFAVIPACRIIDTDSHTISKQIDKDCLDTVPAYRYLKRMIEGFGKSACYLYDTAADIGCCQQGKPYDRNDSAKAED